MKGIIGILATLLLALPSLYSSSEDTFSINGREIIVPTPEGFVRVTEEMPAVFRYLSRISDPVNDTLAYYITEKDATAALTGEFPPLERTLLLKINKQLRHRAVGPREFSGMIKIIQAQNQKIFQRLQNDLKLAMDDTSSGISEEFDIDFALGVSQMVPLDPHFQSENCLSYSLYINYDVSANDANSEVIVAATSTFLNLSGVVLFQYSYASKPDLEWTREISKDWAEATFLANDVDISTSEEFHTEPWKETVTYGVLGAACGVGATLIYVFISRRKNRKR
tara:strand:+ start:22186 stop:23028 length:843 start_codon:yes stop_codon:yes gene_type:complete